MMDYYSEKLAILAETDMVRLTGRDLDLGNRAIEADRRGDMKTLHNCIRLGHWVSFRTADFTILDLPIVDEHTHARVGDLSLEAFAAAIEVEPPPQTFEEALALAAASRGN